MAALLFLALRQAPLAQIWTALSRLRGWQLLALAVLNGVILALMAARWALCLRALGARAPLRTLLAYRLAGFGVSYLTPGPQFGGEPLQVHLLHSNQGVALPVAVSSVVLDRLVDQLANFTFLVAGAAAIMLLGLAGPPLNAAALLVSGSLLLLPLAHLLALWRGRRPVTWAAGWLAARRPAALRLVDTVSEAEGQIARFLRGQPRVFAQILLISALTWAFFVVEFWLTLLFLGAEAGLAESVAAQTAARLAYLLPFPAGLGALETSQVLATRLLGWEAASGVALSLVIRARDLFLAACGLWFGGAAYRQRREKRTILEERIL